MQKLKKLPLLTQLGNTTKSLLGSVKPLLGRLNLSSRPLMMAALIVGFLILCFVLCGCSPRMVRPSLPPQADPRPVPEFEGRTYRDVLLYVVELRESCQASEADKAAIRDVFK